MCDNQVVNGETKAGGCKLPNATTSSAAKEYEPTYTDHQMPSTLSCVPRPPCASQHTSTPSNTPPSSAPV